MPRHPWPIPALVAVAALAVLLSACGESKEEKAEKARQAYVVPATILPLPTDTPAPTDTPEPTVAVPVVAASGTLTVTGRSRLPKDKAAPVVQIARVEARASEPGVLAEMAPEFSLTADGRGVFHTLQGGSASDWYQTALTEEQTQRFLSLLVDQIGVLRLAEGRSEAPVDLSFDARGNPRGPAALGVIYVRTANEEGRLVLTEADLANALDPAMQRLTALLIALENWKGGVRAPIDPLVAPFVAEQLGWWSDLRQPWTPETVVALGGKAPAGLRSAVATWPLEVDPGSLFQAEPGEQPDFAVFSDADAAALLEAQIKAGLDPNTPLWQFPGSDQRYLIGLRPGVPGGNHIWVAHEAGAAPAPAATSGAAAAATQVPGSAPTSRPTPRPSATPRP